MVYAAFIPALLDPRNGKILVPPHDVALDGNGYPIANKDVVIPTGAKYELIHGKGWQLGFPEAEAIPDAEEADGEDTQVDPVSDFDYAFGMSEEETTELFDSMFDHEGDQEEANPTQYKPTPEETKEISKLSSKYNTPTSYVKGVYWTIDMIQTL